jgi:hypothetical protein
MRIADAESLKQALGGCADAAGWSAQKAEDWWRTFEPSALREGEGSPPIAPESGSAGTRVESSAPVTVAAERVEPTGSRSDEDAEIALTLGEDRTRPDRQA